MEKGSSESWAIPMFTGQEEEECREGDPEGEACKKEEKLRESGFSEEHILRRE